MKQTKRGQLRSFAAYPQCSADQPDGLEPDLAALICGSRGPVDSCTPSPARFGLVNRSPDWLFPEHPARGLCRLLILDHRIQLYVNQVSQLVTCSARAVMSSVSRRCQPKTEPGT